MLAYQFRPLVTWPANQPQTRHPLATVFRAKDGKPMPLSDTINLLETELKPLSGKNVIVQVALDASAIRLDGRIKANAKKPAYPGVILTFDSQYGTLSYPCDTFTDWESNLRAIAMHLNHVRMALAYGVGKSGEAYKGFRAVPGAAGAAGSAGAAKASATTGQQTKAKSTPPPKPAPPPRPLTAKEKAVLVLCRYGKYEQTRSGIAECLADKNLLRQVYLSAVRAAHPDTGGTNEAFIEVREAWNLLQE